MPLLTSARVAAPHGTRGGSARRHHHRSPWGGVAAFITGLAIGGALAAAAAILAEVIA